MEHAQIAQNIEQLLKDAAGYEAGIEAIVELDREGDPGWMLNLDEDMIFAEYHEAAGLLFLRLPIEIPESSNSELLYGSLLRHNGLCAQTGGLSIALDEDGTDLHLILPVALASTDGETLARLLRSLAERAAEWREGLAEMKGVGDDVPPSLPGMDPWIRA